MKKSEVLGFHPWQQMRGQFQDTGNLLVDMALQDPTASLDTMPWPKRTHYLGLHYGADTPFESCTNELYAVGSVYALSNKLRRQGLMLPKIGIKCFATYSPTVLKSGRQSTSYRSHDLIVVQTRAYGLATLSGPLRTGWLSCREIFSGT